MNAVLPRLYLAAMDIPGLPPDFSPWLRDKVWVGGLGTRLKQAQLVKELRSYQFSARERAPPAISMACMQLHRLLKLHIGRPAGSCHKG